jgi:hypothetical protein
MEEHGGGIDKFMPAENKIIMQEDSKYISPKFLFVLFKLRKSLFPHITNYTTVVCMDIIIIIIITVINSRQTL